MFLSYQVNYWKYWANLWAPLEVQTKTWGRRRKWAVDTVRELIFHYKGIFCTHTIWEKGLINKFVFFLPEVFALNALLKSSLYFQATSAEAQPTNLQGFGHNCLLFRVSKGVKKLSLEPEKCQSVPALISDPWWQQYHVVLANAFVGNMQNALNHGVKDRGPSSLGLSKAGTCPFAACVSREWGFA